MSQLESKLEAKADLSVTDIIDETYLKILPLNLCIFRINIYSQDIKNTEIMI